MKLEIGLSHPPLPSYRVAQLCSRFDITPQHAARTLSAELPDRDEPWQVGVIVGPSGSGKSTIARRAFGDDYYRPPAWPQGAIIDAWERQYSLQQITHALTAVGLASVPAWLKSADNLSNGERFRADCARALLSGRNRIVIDEFTSVLDRKIAQLGSVAIAKAVRHNDQMRGDFVRQFVGVTCHEDILPWLEPDWILWMPSGRLQRGCLRRGKIEIRIHRGRRADWSLFAEHHYINRNLPHGVKIYIATDGNRPVAFAAVGRHFGKANGPLWVISRLVVLPEYQGLGIGGKFLDTVAELASREQVRLRITTGHPGIQHHLQHSQRWKLDRVQKAGFSRRHLRGPRWKTHGTVAATSAGRPVVSAEFCRSSA